MIPLPPRVCSATRARRPHHGRAPPARRCKRSRPTARRSQLERRAPPSEASLPGAETAENSSPTKRRLLGRNHASSPWRPACRERIRDDHAVEGGYRAVRPRVSSTSALRARCAGRLRDSALGSDRCAGRSADRRQSGDAGHYADRACGTGRSRSAARPARSPPSTTLLGRVCHPKSKTTH